MVYFSILVLYPLNIQYTPYTEDYIADEWTKAPSGRYYKFENMLILRTKWRLMISMVQLQRWRTTPDKFEELWNALKQRFRIAMVE